MSNVFLRNPPIHFILYVGTNILVSNQTSEEISTYIINLALLMKGESHDISIASVILRTDDKRLYQKGYEVNEHLGKNVKRRMST